MENIRPAKTPNALRLILKGARYYITPHKTDYRDVLITHEYAAMYTTAQ